MNGEYVKASQEEHLIPSVVYTEIMKAVLQKNVHFRFTAPGFSMSPFIRDGDIITIAPVSGRLNTGDVVAYSNPRRDNLIVHRILKVSRDGYLIKGDNNSSPDGRISSSSIIGRVVLVEHCNREVKIGLGIERVVLAWMSRNNILKPVIRRMWPVLKPLIGNLIS